MPPVLYWPGCCPGRKKHACRALALRVSRRLRRPWKKKGIVRGHPAPRPGDCVPRHPLLKSYLERWNICKHKATKSNSTLPTIGIAQCVPRSPSSRTRTGAAGMSFATPMWCACSASMRPARPTASGESTVQARPTGPAFPTESSIIRLTPPRQRHLRNLVTQAFTPRMVTQLEPSITAITNELLDHVAAAGEMDVVRDLAYPLPVTVISELLGIPAELREDFKRWSDALVASDEGTSEEERKALFQEVQGMYGYFAQVLEERRQHPQN